MTLREGRDCYDLQPSGCRRLLDEAEIRRSLRIPKA
ncbi:MAG: hypothetical protein ACI9EF_003447 [Pseudohongiellaceae bacterium]|jgi:hypothetical protein